MTEFIIRLNDALVSIFGCLLAFAYCGLDRTKKGRLQTLTITLGLLMVQVIMYLSGWTRLLKYLYPLLIHLPLVLSLCVITKRWLWSFGSVLLAYLCCQVRRWIALLMVMLFFHREEAVLPLIQVVLTPPILYLLLRYTAKPVSELAAQPMRTQVKFCVIPLLYYFYDYVAVVYTKWLYSGVAAAVEFMPFVCCIGYLLFLLLAEKEMHKYADLEISRNSLNLQVKQSVQELQRLREAQQNAARYRHDLRHYLQYLSVCISNGELEQAQEFIHDIHQEIDKQIVVPYCRNEPVNLILSSFANQAKQTDITLRIRADLPENTEISVHNLCVVLSNGLENALNACQALSDKQRWIEVELFQEDGTFYLQVSNPCQDDICFVNGLPVAHQAGHGTGTRSIQTVVEHHHGTCQFFAQNGVFTLQLSLQVSSTAEQNPSGLQTK